MAIEAIGQASSKARPSTTDQATAQLQATLACMAEGLYRIDTDGRLIYMNPSCERILGYRLSEVQGRDFHDLVHSSASTDDPESDLCPVLNVIKSGKPFHSEDMAFVTSSGHKLSCTVTSNPLIINGEIAGVVVCFHDNALTREAEANRRMLELMQQREDFMSTLTHDLKTPIVATDRVLAFILEDSRGDVPARVLELLSKLKTSNQALLVMVQTLLSVYRYECGAEELVSEPVSIHGLIAECVEEVRILADGKNLRVGIQCDEDVVLIGDHLGLRRVFSNLLSNAIKFTPGPGAISIKVNATDTAVSITVADTGVGISAEDIAHLFERFQRGRAAKRNREIGTGLGLYLCKQIIRAHGGDITCNSDESGSTFTVTLPRNNSSEKQDHQEIQPSVFLDRG